jgi:DNA-binding transcriptional regulator YiaG
VSLVAKGPTAAEELRAIREGLGLSQLAMAKAIDTPHRTYQRWEAGESRVPAEPLLAAYKLRDAEAKKKKRGA